MRPDNLGSCLITTLFASVAGTVPTSYTLDEGQRGRHFLGYGVNPSAGTYRLLHDYAEPMRSQILDYMFLPNFGASYHRIKVEIGGDGQGTCGSEASHMRTSTDANFSRGYAWWLLAEAKRRNPEIVTYGLPESWPRWVANNSMTAPGPLDIAEKASKYITTWVLGAKRVHNLTIDWVGMWNGERRAREGMNK